MPPARTRRRDAGGRKGETSSSERRGHLARQVPSSFQRRARATRPRPSATFLLRLVRQPKSSFADALRRGRLHPTLIFRARLATREGPMLRNRRARRASWKDARFAQRQPMQVIALERLDAGISRPGGRGGFTDALRQKIGAGWRVLMRGRGAAKRQRFARAGGPRLRGRLGGGSPGASFRAKLAERVAQRDDAARRE